MEVVHEQPLRTPRLVGIEPVNDRYRISLGVLGHLDRDAPPVVLGGLLVSVASETYTVASNDLGRLAAGDVPPSEGAIPDISVSREARPELIPHAPDTVLDRFRVILIVRENSAP